MIPEESSLNVRPLRLSVRELGLTADSPALVDQLEWAAFVPMIHRAMANPAGGEPVPERPIAGDSNEDFLSFWFPALYLMVYSLGWTDPGLGLQRWFAAGRPTDDVRFALLSKLWDQGNALDLLAAWLWRSNGNWIDELRERLGLAPSASSRIDPGVAWWESLEDRFGMLRPQGIYMPFFGGGDPMHLQTHILGPVIEEAGGDRTLLFSVKERKATLMLDKMQGWFGALNEMGSTLPNIGERSWHVEVVCKPVGWLGTYRRSRATGMWFAGPHRIHMMGNPDG